jgi:hypothetical protein
MADTGNTSSDPSGRSGKNSNGTTTVSFTTSDGQTIAQNELNREAKNAADGTIFTITDPNIVYEINSTTKIPVLNSKGQFTGTFVENSQAARQAYSAKGATFNNSQNIGLKVAGDPNASWYKGYFQLPAPPVPPSTGKKTGKGPKGTTPTPPATPPETVDPNKWSWNLPPHKWSLPRTLSGNDFSSAPLKQHSDMYRRGRIWWKWNDPSIQLTQNAGGGATDKYITTKNGNNTQFGFQFLWNPTDFNTAVSVQMDSTPSAGDRFLGGAGFFPGTESITITIHLDRTNDFAAAASKLSTPNTDTNNPNSQVAYGKTLLPFVTRDQVQDFIPFYTQGTGFTSSTNVGGIDMQDKLVDLFQRGTIADLEFLYRTINGVGPAGSTTQAWVNGRGQKTADIGFLQPTLVNIDIGPLSYAGYVNNLSVTHKMFTVDMIPISTDVTMSLQLLATAGIQNQAQKATVTATTAAPIDTSASTTSTATTPVK